MFTVKMQITGQDTQVVATVNYVENAVSELELQADKYAELFSKPIVTTTYEGRTHADLKSLKVTAKLMGREIDSAKFWIVRESHSDSVFAQVDRAKVAIDTILADLQNANKNPMDTDLDALTAVVALLETAKIHKF